MHALLFSLILHLHLSYATEDRWLHGDKLGARIGTFPIQTFALVCSFANGVKRRYGFTMFSCGYCFCASSVLTDGCTITSSPGSQFIGVVTLCLSPVCSESTMRNTSAVLRPVEAG